jgi:mono/diheme cytochrome c family protein
LAVAAAAAAVAAYAYAQQPDAAPSAAPAPVTAGDTTLIEHGARLAALGDCMACHTAKGGEPYAGGVPLNTPFGTIYSTNITPDANTGIGSWSLDDFKRALREGVSRDGHLLYPAFPYPHFTRITDDDAAALYAYMMARTPVSAPARANDLMFPFNFRPLLWGWNMLFLHKGELPAPETPQSDEWLRGRYLVEGLGHCASCHTPMNAFGAEKSGSPFAGGVIDGWTAPALTALGQAPTPWTSEQLVAYLRGEVATEHGAAAGPMLPVTVRLASADPADIKAMATYLLSLQKPGAAQPAAATATAAAANPDSASITRGGAVFAAACASCHGDASPMSQFGQRPGLGQGSSMNADTPRNAANMVLWGNPWMGSSSAQYMPSFSAVLTDDQIADVLAYVRQEHAKKPAWQDLPGTVSTVRKEAQPQ